MKSGRVTPGYELTRQGLERGKVHFVLAAADLSPRRLQALTRVAGERHVPLVVEGTSRELGALLDRGATGVVGITHRSLARGMAAELPSPRSEAGVEKKEEGVRRGAR
ncbi:MAG: ribosomal L7Ae/L30e/S12e/Gadd45 family protein [Gemmatimonadetes bacterium]|nr:ribosomal L7Ae/L30e/S12e/Gadd45 family protein [Gemmatimonadota bacterium]